MKGVDLLHKSAKFQTVSYKQFYKDWKEIFDGKKHESFLAYKNIKIPERKTKFSAGHDISIPFNATIPAGGTLKIPTGIRCKMNRKYVMFIFPRSSLGIKKNMVLTNTVPVIDSDYYSADNEGHIFICIKNNGSEPLALKAGDDIVQAVFVPYGVADNKRISRKRTGGIGSTDK